MQTIRRRQTACWQRRNATHWMNRLQRRRAAVRAIQQRFGKGAITMGDGRMIGARDEHQMP